MSRWELKRKKQVAIKKALVDSFEIIHHQVTANNYYHDSTVSGSTLTVVLISDDNQIFTANVGDTRATVFQVELMQLTQDEINQTLLTTDHDPLH